MQIRLALFMSMTVIEFNIFQIPFTVMVLTVLYQTVTGKVTLNHEFATFAFSILWSDSIINPLWTCFISKRVKRNESSLLSKSSIWRLNKLKNREKPINDSVATGLKSNCEMSLFTRLEQPSDGLSQKEQSEGLSNA